METESIVVAIVVVILGALFLLVSRLGRRKRERCERPSHAVMLWRHLLLLVTIVTIVIIAFLKSKGLALGFAVPLGIAGALLAVTLLIAGAATKAAFGWRGLIRTPRYVPIVLRALWCINERADFAAARRASRKSGRIFREDGLALWTDMETNVETDLKDALRISAVEFAQLTGLSDDATPPLRAIIFEHEASFMRYTKSAALIVPRQMGNYNGGPAKRMTLCCELSKLFPATLRHVMIHEAAHHFLWSKLGRSEPAWLQEGIATLTASRTARQQTAPGAKMRALMAAQARRELLTGAELFSMTHAKLLRKLSDWRNTDEIGASGTLYKQSASFTDFLCKEHTDKLKEFLKRLAGKKREVSKTFLDCFEMTPDDAMSRWFQWFKASDVPDYVAPSDELKRRIENELVARIRDPEIPIDERLLTIRRMAAAGYPWGVSVLIDVLKEPEGPLRTDAQRALENIAGETRGSEAAVWHEWLDSLPAGVSGAFDSLSAKQRI